MESNAGLFCLSIPAGWQILAGGWQGNTEDPYP